MKSFFLLFSFLFGFVSTISLAQSVQKITPTKEYKWFSEGVEVFPVCDEKGSSIHEVSKPAFRHHFAPDSLFTKGCKHWIKIRMFSEEKKPLQYLLRNTDRFGTSHFFILEKDSTFTELLSGVTVPPEQRAFPYAGYNAIPFICLPQDTLTIFIFQDFITDESARKVRFSYMSWGTEEMRQRSLDHTYLLLAITAFLILVIYNMAIYFFVKDSAYLFYSLTFVFLIPYMLVINFSEWQWTYLRESTRLLPQLSVCCGPLAGLFYNLFALKYLKGKKEYFTWEKYVRKAFYALSFFAMYNIPLILIVGYGSRITIFHLIGDIILFGTIFAIFIYSIVLVFKGNIQARYFVIASVSFLPFLAVFYLQGDSFNHYGYLNIIEGNAFTRASFKIGEVVQALMFSLALAARINVLRKDLIAQELKVEKVEREKLQTVNQLIEQQKIDLEAKVDERTRLLQESNEELRISEENLERLNQAKDRLFAVVAHDLREPIISFQMLSKVMAFQMKKNRPEKVEELVTQIDDSAQQLNAMLDNLLKWAQTQMEGIKKHPQQILLKPLVEEIARLYQSTAEAKSISTRIEITPENLPVWADPNFVITIIRNLWSNAIKFTSAGEVVLSAYAESDKVWIEVYDTGVGIPPEKLTSLFEINAAKSTKGTQGEKGNGLGLNLCKTFVELSGGEISLESKEGKGTTVQFWLPAFQVKKDS